MFLRIKVLVTVVVILQIDDIRHPVYSFKQFQSFRFISDRG